MLGKSHRLVSPASSVFPHSMIWSVSWTEFPAEGSSEVIDRDLQRQKKAR
jgi:hypothetical protein